MYSDFWWNLFDSAFTFSKSVIYWLFTLVWHLFFFSVLTSEVHDLRIVLQSADKELSAVKLEYRAFREKQEKEMSQLSDRHMDVQFKLDSVRYVGSLVKCLNLPSWMHLLSADLQTKKCTVHFLEAQKATLDVLSFFFFSPVVFRCMMEHDEISRKIIK